MFTIHVIIDYARTLMSMNFFALNRCHDLPFSVINVESDSKSLVPRTWDKSMVSGYSQVIVDENANGEEYQKVSTAFHRTCGDGVKMQEVF